MLVERMGQPTLEVEVKVLRLRGTRSTESQRYVEQALVVTAPGAPCIAPASQRSPSVPREPECPPCRVMRFAMRSGQDGGFET